MSMVMLKERTSVWVGWGKPLANLFLACVLSFWLCAQPWQRLVCAMGKQTTSLLK